MCVCVCGCVIGDVSVISMCVCVWLSAAALCYWLCVIVTGDVRVCTCMDWWYHI